MCQTFLVGKKALYCLNYLNWQEGQLPNIRTMLATILTVPRHLRAQPTWYTSPVYSCKVRSGISVWPRGSATRAQGCTSPILADNNHTSHNCQSPSGRGPRPNRTQWASHQGLSNRQLACNATVKVRGAPRTVFPTPNLPVCQQLLPAHGIKLLH